MKPKTIALTSILVILCSIAGFLVSELIAQRNKKYLIVVAKRNYPKGTAITNAEEMFEMRSTPGSELPPLAIFFFEDLQGRSLTRDITAGEPILLSDLERTRNLK
jgi:flagella basal body P-ring formation protein FlgA